MKLVLEEKSPWPVHTLPDEEPITAVAPTVANRDLELVVLVRPLEPLRAFWGPWKEAMTNWGKPPKGSIDLITETKGKSTVDWPIEVIESLVKDEGGKVVEARLTVLYFLLEWCCMVAICGRPEKLAAERERALGLLRSGRPDWSTDSVAAIAQLYE